MSELSEEYYKVAISIYNIEFRANEYQKSYLEQKNVVSLLIIKRLQDFRKAEYRLNYILRARSYLGEEGFVTS
jgi:hypothetical protein